MPSQSAKSVGSRRRSEALDQTLPRSQRQNLEALLAGAPRAEPCFVEPMKCKLVSELPKSAGWLYEFKFDGYRALAVKRGRQVKLISRNRKDLSAGYAEIVQSLQTLKCRNATLDGEIAVLDERGLPSFQALQNFESGGSNRARLFYFLFDVINYDGRDVRQLPLEMRKTLLQGLARVPLPHIRFVRAVEGPGLELLNKAKEQGLEGLIGKKSMSAYEAGRRSGTWIKYKILQSQEFVIGGYTQPEGSRECFGALLIGYYRAGKLYFASKVGTGFSPALIRKLYSRVQPLVRRECPFANLPEKSSGRWGRGLSAREMRQCTWLTPKLVCEVHFTEWTEGGHLRHPSFKGLREDKRPEEVVREMAERQGTAAG